jgi:tetratricopeptide (TPR) repeat protein
MRSRRNINLLLGVNRELQAGFAVSGSELHRLAEEKTSRVATLGVVLLALAALAGASPLLPAGKGVGSSLPSGQPRTEAEELASLQAMLARLSPSDPTRAGVLINIAGIETDSGNYPSAQRHASEAAAIYAGSGDGRRRAWALNRAGLASTYAGDYPLAEQMLRSAMALSTGVGDEQARSEEITDLANVSFFVGHYADAAAGYDAALRIVDSHRDQGWSSRQRHLILVNQAILDQRLGRDEEALAIYRQVRGEKELRPREQGQVLMNLGVLYRHLGDPIKALSAYDEARHLFAQEQEKALELSVAKNRGIVLALDLGQLEAARAAFSEVVDGAAKIGDQRDVLQGRLYRGETEMRLGLLEPASQDFRAGLELARFLRTPEEEWKALYGLARAELQKGDRVSAVAHLVSAIAIVEKVREAIRVPTLRSDFFNEKRVVYDALISVELGQAEPQRIFELIERSHSRAWRDRIGLTSGVALAAVQRSLPADVLLFDIWSSPFGSAIVSVTRDRVEVHRIQVAEAAIRKLVEVFDDDPGGDWRTPAAAIGAHLLPVVPRGIRHVIVIPDGPLTLVPFEILPLDGRMLVEQAAVTYMPTAAMLFRDRAPQHAVVAPWALELRGFADPIFGSAALDDPVLVRSRLLSSAREVRDIAAELGGGSIVHLGRDNRKSYLYDRDVKAPILHIASHAIADANAIEQSRILFSPATDKGVGADYLFLKEAYELHLEGVDLAVLSACDTERGRLLRGEGVQSFSRAFLAAGARSTITTLWRVPDASTAAFMKVFYYHIQRGASRATALQMAKLRFLRSGSGLADPHYWAAFVLTGEGLQPVPTAVRWSSVLLASAAVLLVGLLIWRVY